MQTQRQDEHNLSWELLKASFSKAGSQSSFWLELPGGSRWEVELAAGAGGQSSFLKVFPGAQKLSSRQRPLHVGWGGSVFAAHKGGEARISVIANPRLPPGQNLVPGRPLRARICCRVSPGFNMPGWFSAGQDLVLGGTFRGEDLVLGGPPGPGFGAGRDLPGYRAGPPGQDLVPGGTLWC